MTSRDEALRALEKVAADLDADATRDREAGESMYSGGIESYEADDPADVADGLIFAAEFSEKRAAEIRSAIALLATASEQTPVADSELPGMWSASDFTGGDPDERCYSDRDLFASNLRSALGKHYDPEAGIVCSVALLAADKNTSPAHTSEARDAAARNLLSALDQHMYPNDYCGYEVGKRDADAVSTAIEALRAAMRQEAE